MRSNLSEWLKLRSGSDIRGNAEQLTGQENIPAEGGFMLYANHQGMFDVLAIAATCDRPIGAAPDGCSDFPPAPMTGEGAPGAPSPLANASHSSARRLMAPSQTSSAQEASWGGSCLIYEPSMISTSSVAGSPF